jgi:preprotein translocase subunit SecB
MTEEKKTAAKEPGKKDDGKRISISKIYVKDFSFESPKAPDVFRSAEWKPQTDLNLRSGHKAIEGEDSMHEVVLTITIDAKEGDSTLFLVELQQAGLFHIAGYEEEEFKAILGSFCPNVLFPYAREAIANAIARGGFPEFLLQPINFDALYMQSQQQLAQQQAEAAEKH